MASLDELHRNLQSQLQGLKESIPALQNDPKYLGLFDEFLREHEFGLALETLCDFLLEPKTASLSWPLLEQIESLHELMNVRDGCGQKLRDKTASSKKVL